MDSVHRGGDDKRIATDETVNTARFRLRLRMRFQLIAVHYTRRIFN
jgi:hypothetical protein